MDYSLSYQLNQPTDQQLMTQHYGPFLRSSWLRFRFNLLPARWWHFLNRLQMEQTLDVFNNDLFDDFKMWTPEHTWNGNLKLLENDVLQSL